MPIFRSQGLPNTWIDTMYLKQRQNNNRKDLKITMIVIHSLVPPIDLHFCYKIVIVLLTITTKQISEAEEKPFTSCLKGLSHKMDLTFEDMHGPK